MSALSGLSFAQTAASFSALALAETETQRQVAVSLDKGDSQSSPIPAPVQLPSPGNSEGMSKRKVWQEDSESVAGASQSEAPASLAADRQPPRQGGSVSGKLELSACESFKLDGGAAEAEAHAALQPQLPGTVPAAGSADNAAQRPRPSSRTGCYVPKAVL